MILEGLSFIYGILINVIDYMNDSNLFVDYKRICEWIFIGMTVFFFLSDTYVSFFGSSLFLFGGIVGMFLTPHAVDAFIWKSVIYLSIPVFIYHLVHMPSLLEGLTSEDILQFFFCVMPIIVVALLLALVEDYLVPEEHGTKKLYDKAFQCIVMLSFLYMLNYSTYFETITEKNKLILNIFALVWLGNVTSGVYILSQLSHLFIPSKVHK